MNTPIKYRSKNIETESECKEFVRPVRDVLEVLNGKWKLPIIITLSFGAKRFRQIANQLNGITDKMLSKELKDLEAHKLITRKVVDTFPPTVEYTITEHGASLEKVIAEIRKWGVEHRKTVIKPGSKTH